VKEDAESVAAGIAAAAAAAVAVAEDNQLDVSVATTTHVTHCIQSVITAYHSTTTRHGCH